MGGGGGGGFSHTSDIPPCREQLWDKSISHGFHDLQLCTVYLAWLKCKVCENALNLYKEFLCYNGLIKVCLENAFCMVFHVRWISHLSSPNPTLVAARLGRDSETCAEKNPSRMANHTKCISSSKGPNPDQREESHVGARLGGGGGCPGWLGGLSRCWSLLTDLSHGSFLSFAWVVNSLFQKYVAVNTMINNRGVNYLVAK